MLTWQHYEFDAICIIVCFECVPSFFEKKNLNSLSVLQLFGLQNKKCSFNVKNYFFSFYFTYTNVGKNEV